MARLYAAVYHTLGTFTGEMRQSTDLKEMTVAEAKELVDELAVSVETIERLVLYTHDGKLVAIKENILKQSVMSFWYVE